MNKISLRKQGSFKQARQITPRQTTQAGFLEIIVVIIIALVILNVLGIKISDILAKPWVHEFGVYFVSMMKLVWQDILEIIAFFKGLAA
jgi:hypothetical protein